jgi:hypothetical protein
MEQFNHQDTKDSGDGGQRLDEPCQKDAEPPMPMVNLRIPVYCNAMHKFVWRVLEGLLILDPVLHDLPSRPTSHSGPNRNVPGFPPLDHELSKFSESIVFHADTMKYTDIDAVVTTLVDLSLKHQSFMGKTFFETILGVTTAVGNSVDGGGQPLSADSMLRLIEMIDIDFDEDGNPRMPSIFVNPKDAHLIGSIEKTPEDDVKWNAMMARKKEEWNAKQRYRRLSRQGK